MEHIKLQMGCFLIVFYIIFIYYKEKRDFHQKERSVYFEILLWVCAASIILDGATAYTVNHLHTVPSLLNLILHCLFLVSIDCVIFSMTLYILSISDGFPEKKSHRIVLFFPFFISIITAVFSINRLRYEVGNISNYSMGTPVYACFFISGVYTLLCVALIFRRWRRIESHKRIGILTGLFVVVCVTTYQMFVPEALITAIGTTMIILGAYMNHEDPAMAALEQYHTEMVTGFATLVEKRDDNTGGHVHRTTLYVKLLTRELRKKGYYRDILTRDYTNNLIKAAPMHDIGKIAIPDSILQKPGKLTKEEFETMKQHTVIGHKIIQDTFGNLQEKQYSSIAAEIALYHHEKWNGRGYPEGLQGENIPLSARIMAIADVFDAISQKRCYREAMPLEQCFSIIAEGKGTDFDPLLTEVFLDIREKVESTCSQTLKS